MEFVYLLINGISNEWEDIVVLLTKEDAIDTSKKYPNHRVEIFTKTESSIGYKPTYNYYKNGDYISVAT